MVGSRDFSNHYPICIKGNSTNWGPKSFKFFNYWIHHLEFIPFVEKI